MALTGLVGGLMVAVLTPPAQAAPVHYCDDGKPAPCLVSVLRNGTPVDRDVYLATVDGYTPPEDKHTTGFTLSKAGVAHGLGPGELGATFTVTMKTGTIKPRVIDGWGRNGRSTRYVDSDGDWAVKIVVKPADMLMSCHDTDGDGVVTCPATAAPADHITYVVMRISDASWHGSTEAARDRLWGLESYSDIQLFWYPPSITTSGGVVTMDFLMQNAHSYPDGSTFHGTANMRIPNRVLRDLYGIPAPETMTAGSFTSTSTSGSVASYQETGDDAWRVDLTGVTFSKQHLKLKRGVITPTRPDVTRTKRVSAGSARLTFVTSKPRGARVKGYQVRCVSGGGHVVQALKSTTRSPVSISGLRRGAAYTCKLRARSQVGWSTWSFGHKVKSRVGAVG